MSTRVSVERVVSGPGILAIYQFLRDHKQYKEPADIANEVKAWEKSGSDSSEAPAKNISKVALEKKDALCMKVMQMFVGAYGSEVGNFALKLLPYEGLYVVGDIASEILKDNELKELFMDELRKKGRMRDKVIEKIPIYLVKNKRVGLIGAAHYAKRLLIQ